MAKTEQEYFDEDIQRRSAQTEQEYDARKANTQKTLDAQYQIIDSGLNNAVGKYQQQIDEAPGVYQQDYDRNALAEMVNRKKLEESMANLGLTDSGLNRTQQTTLSVQRGNADAATGQSMREYVNKLETAINDLTLEAENQKKTMALTATQADMDWYNNRTQEDRDASSAYAASMVAADKQAEATRYAAEQQAQASYYEYLQKLAESGKTVDESGNIQTATYTDDMFQQAQDAYKTYGQEYLDSYILTLKNRYNLSNAAAYALADAVISTTDLPWSKRQYTPNYDGGPYIGQLNDNATVNYTDFSGNERTIRLDELYKNLLAEGMTRNQALVFLRPYNQEWQKFYQDRADWHM